MNKISLVRLKMVYGFILLGIMAILATAIAMGKVEQQTSYGLMPIIVALATLATQFAGWAFGPKPPNDDTTETKE